MRIGSLVLVVWLVIGTLAAFQRDYLTSGGTDCAKLGSTVLTVLAGPLNYVGLNPVVRECTVPEPSR